MIFTDEHVRIWLTPNPSIFMNWINEWRVIQFLQDNPAPVRLQIIYSSGLLNGQGQQDLSRFQKAHPRVNLTDFDTQIAPPCEEMEYSVNDRELCYWAKNELWHCEPPLIGGNLGAVSDIIRILTPVAGMGIYSDFDTTIKTQGIPPRVLIPHAFLCNIEVFSISIRDNSKQITSYNHDILAFDREHDGALSAVGLWGLQNFQSTLLSHYQDCSKTVVTAANSQPSFFQKVFGSQNSIFQLHEDLSPIELRAMIQNIGNLYMTIKLGYPILRDSAFVRAETDKDIAFPPMSDALKRKLLEDFSDPLRFDFSSGYSAEQYRECVQLVQVIFHNDLRALEEQMRALLRYGFDYQSAAYQVAGEHKERLHQAISQITQGDPDRTLNDFYHNQPPSIYNAKLTLLKDSVTMVSGPSVIQKVIEYQFVLISMKYEISAKEYAKLLSFDNDPHLRGFAFSKNSSMLMYQYQERGIGREMKIGDGGDLSWLPIGKKAIEKNELIFSQASSRIARAWQKSR